jgi:hypothetical protein
MSQVDILNYFPILAWSIVLLLLFYFMIVSYVLPLIFGVLKVRSLYNTSLINGVLKKNYFFLILKKFYFFLKFDIDNFFSNYYIFFKKILLNFITIDVILYIQ